jgi:hypothetical protein
MTPGLNSTPYVETRMDADLAAKTAKAKHILRQKNYYQRNADAIKQRKRDNYDAAKSAEYYNSKREHIRERQKDLYLTHKKTGQQMRLSELLNISDPQYHPLIQTLISAVNENAFNDNEIMGIEKAILLSRNYDESHSNNGASDSKVDE